MTSTKLAVDALARHTGLPPKRVRAVAVALTEGGLLPPGAPGKSPELYPEHAITLLIGACLDAPLRAVADTVLAYRALTPGGVSLDGAPHTLRTAGDALDIFAEIAVRGDSDVLRREMIEVVTSWPEIAIHTDGAAKRFQSVGTLPNHWQATGHRKATTINGAALVDALRELFKDAA